MATPYRRSLFGNERDGAGCALKLAARWTASSKTWRHSASRSGVSESVAVPCALSQVSKSSTGLGDTFAAVSRMSNLTDLLLGDRVRMFRASITHSDCGLHR